MAQVKFDNRIISATPVVQLPNGNYHMRSRQHSARLAVGTMFEVRPQDIVQMDEAEKPGNAPLPEDLKIGPVPADKVGMSELEAAMAAERKTLPTVQELLAAHQKDIAEGKTPKGPFQVPRSNPGSQPGQPQ